MSDTLKRYFAMELCGDDGSVCAKGKEVLLVSDVLPLLARAADLMDQAWRQLPNTKLSVQCEDFVDALRKEIQG